MITDLAIDFSSFVKELYSTEESVPLHSPQFNIETAARVQEVILSTFVSSVGPEVTKFENKICEYTEANYAVATVNGTAALHLCLLAVNVGPDDLVLTSPLTFVATCNAIKYTGADPVFLDIDQESLSIDPVVLFDFLQKETEMRDDGNCWHQKTNRVIRACLPTHCLGHPARIAEILSICTNHCIEVVEDAAEALGSWDKSQHVGIRTRASALSFNGNKIITTGGGGIVLLREEDDAKRVKHLSTQAKVAHSWEFNHDKIGFNYRMPNLNAALGLGQIDSLPSFLQKKRSLFLIYREWFLKKGLPMFEERKETKSNYWLNSVLLPSRTHRDKFLEKTNQNGVMTRPLWQPMHVLPMYSECARTRLDVAETISGKLVTLPSSPLPNRM